MANLSLGHDVSEIRWHPDPDALKVLDVFWGSFYWDPKKRATEIHHPERCPRGSPYLRDFIQTSKNDLEIYIYVKTIHILLHTIYTLVFAILKKKQFHFSINTHYPKITIINIKRQTI